MDKQEKFIELTRDFADAFSSANYQKALEIAKETVKQYPDLSEPYLRLGIVYLATGNIHLAYENMLIAEKLAKDETLLILIYNQLGQVLRIMGQYDESLIYLDKALELMKKLNATNSITYATILINVASVYKAKGDLKESLFYLKEALNIHKDGRQSIVIYNNIGTIYQELGELSEAVKYFHKSIELCEKYGDIHHLLSAKLNLGNAYREMGDYGNAERYILDGIKDIKKIGDKYWEATGYFYLGWLYKDKGDKETAKELLNRAYNLYISVSADTSVKDVLEMIKELGN
jgi:tetratricopeptide (TPR) repeat protein